MNRASGVAWLGRTMLGALVTVATAGCFLLPRAPDRPGPGVDSGPAPYVENCVTCHVTTTAAYGEGRHAARGVRCGQCHSPGGHPSFSEPVRDAKCGGCHQSEFQQTLASKHFESRRQRSLDGDRTARAALRRDGFTAPTANARHFVADASSGELGGRLCAACHYDGHRLGLRLVQQTNFCVDCHGSLAEHFSDSTPDGQNRCFTCHVRKGETLAGQIVNTHLFKKP